MAFVTRVRIQFLDERTVPRGAVVLFQPVPGHDHIGKVQDVQQGDVFLGGDLDVHGLSSFHGQSFRQYSLPYENITLPKLSMQGAPAGIIVCLRIKADFVVGSG